MNALVSTSAAPLAVERARDLLAKARRVDEAKQIRDQADALALYARKRRASLEAQNDATEIGIWASRRIGELTRTMERSKGGPGRGKKVSADRTSFRKALESEGISRQEAALCEKLAAAPERTIVAHVASVRAQAERLTKSGTIAAVSRVDDYDSDEWYTPDAWLALVRKVLSRIDCDPASCKAAQKRVRAKVFYTKADNGLYDAKSGRPRQWLGRVFCNPPYSAQLCAAFVARFIAEFKAGRMREGILLLNASTDTETFHELARAGALLCFTKGRGAFVGPDGKQVPGNRVGQVFAYLGEQHRALFAEVFDAIGVVLGRIEGRAAARPTKPRTKDDRLPWQERHRNFEQAVQTLRAGQHSKQRARNAASVAVLTTVYCVLRRLEMSGEAVADIRRALERGDRGLVAYIDEILSGELRGSAAAMAGIGEAQVPK